MVKSSYHPWLKRKPVFKLAGVLSAGVNVARQLGAFFVLAMVWVLLAAVPGLTQIALDGSLGAEQSLSGPHYDISADLGHQAGSNLLHSFHTFNLQSGETATFSGPETVNAIISRVTGGSPSRIDGTLRSTIPQADFYFLNPAGVLLGAHATLDVSGSFFVSTADYLKLGSEGRFEAREPARSILSVAPPSAFGFLNDRPAPITVAGSGSEWAAEHSGIHGLSVAAGKRLAIVGGDITLTSGFLNDGTRVESRLRASEGQVDLLALASRGEVALEQSAIFSPHPRFGNITIEDGSYITVSGETAGRIVIRGNQLVLDNSQVPPHVREVSGLYASTWGGFGSETPADGVSESRPNTIDIRLQGDLIVTHDAEITANNFGSAAAGVVRIQAANVFLQDGGSLNVFTMNEGAGSDLILNVGNRLLIEGRGLFAAGIYSSTFAEGNAGNVSIRAAELSIREDGTLTGTTSFRGDEAGEGATLRIDVQRLRLESGGDIETATFGAGDGGSLTIQASESVVIRGGGELQSGLYADTHGEGNAGRITVHTPQLLLADRGVITTDVTFRAGEQARGGDILLMVENLELQTGGTIESSTFRAGAGGQITIQAADRVVLESHGLSSEELSGASHAFNSRIATNSYHQGAAGSITLTARQVEVIGRSNITASGLAEGDGGNITIRASAGLHLDARNDMQGAAILAFSEGGQGGRMRLESPVITLINGGRLGVNSTDGQGGELFIAADQLLIQNSLLFGTTSGDGKGARIEIQANNLLIDGSLDLAGSPAINSLSHGRGDAGDVILNTAALTIQNGGSILTSSHGMGNAGTIRIQAGDSVTLNQGTLNATAFDQGRGGDISIDTPVLQMQNGAVVGAITRGAGDGGHITVNASRVIHLHAGGIGFSGSGIVAGAMGNPEDSGQGGNIVLSTPYLLLSEGSRLDASTLTAGDGGNIRILAGRLTLRDAAEIAAESLGQGRGGDIEITTSHLRLQNSALKTATCASDGGNVHILAHRSAWLSDSRISTSVQGGEGHGGNVSLQAGHLVLTPGSIQANAYKGDGGNLLITAKSIMLDDASQITASSQLGVDGEINIEAPQIDLSGVLVPHIQVLRESPVLIPNPCLTRWQPKAGSVFEVRGREGLPDIP